MGRPFTNSQGLRRPLTRSQARLLQAAEAEAEAEARQQAQDGSTDEGAGYHTRSYRDRGMQAPSPGWEIVQQDCQDEHDCIAGGDFSVARIPVEMYRVAQPRGEHAVAQGATGSQAEKEQDGGEREWNGILYTRKTHLIELCFHADFDPSPELPSSLHFGKDHTVTLRRAPNLPELPHLAPPYYLVECNTLHLYQHEDVDSGAQHEHDDSSDDDNARYYTPDDSLSRPSSRAIQSFLPFARNASNHQRALHSLHWVVFGFLVCCASLLLCYSGTPHLQHWDAAGGTAFSGQFASHNLLYDVSDLMLSWCSHSASLLELDAAKMGEIGLVETSLDQVTEAARNYAIYLEHSHQEPLVRVSTMLHMVCDTAKGALYWAQRWPDDAAESLRDTADATSAPYIASTPPTLAYMSYLCRTAEGHLDAARYAWVVAESYATDSAFSSALQVDRLISDLKKIARSVDNISPMKDNYGAGADQLGHLRFFFDFDFASKLECPCSQSCISVLTGPQQWTHYARQWPPSAYGRPPQPPPELVQTILSAVRARVLEAARNQDPSAVIKAPSFGTKEVEFLDRVCGSRVHEPPFEAAQAVGDGGGAAAFAAHPGCGNQASASTWEGWALFRLSTQDVGTDNGGQYEYIPFVDEVAWTEREPVLLALARHLSTAVALLDVALHGMARIPDGWILEMGEISEYSALRQPSSAHADNDGHGSRYLPPDGSRTLAAFRTLTANISEVRSTELFRQRNLALGVVQGYMETYQAWENLTKVVNELAANGGGQAWWEYSTNNDSSRSGQGKDDQEINARLRLPPPNIMLIILRGLKDNLEALERSAFAHWFNVRHATELHGLSNSMRQLLQKHE